MPMTASTNILSTILRHDAKVTSYKIALLRAINDVALNYPFCAPIADRELLTESATVYAMLDRYPVSPGHTLVIPKAHGADYFALPARGKTACWLVVDRVQALLAERYHPDGFNVGINCGAAAGQTVPHVHIHVIPRYAGDVENPTGGVRHVIPGMGNYLEGESMPS